eukprot:1188456-Prorocentrum_minimum.AAC.7
MYLNGPPHPCPCQRDTTPRDVSQWTAASLPMPARYNATRDVSQWTAASLPMPARYNARAHSAIDPEAPKRSVVVST